MPKLKTTTLRQGPSNGKHISDAPTQLALHKDTQPPVLVGAALTQSESWLRASLEALEDGFAILSSIRDQDDKIEDFRYEYINEAGCRLNQRAREDQLGRSLLELLPAHKEQGLIEAYSQVVETGKAFVESKLHYEDIFGGGKKLARAFDVRVMKLGDGIVAQWRDVTLAARQSDSETEQRLAAETFQDISTILNGTLKCDEVLDHILTQVRRLVPYDTANLMLVEAGVACVSRCQGYIERGLKEPSKAHQLEVSETGNLAWMAATGHPKAIPNTWGSPEWVKLPGSDWIRSYAGAPLRVKGRTIGFLNVNSSMPGLYTEILANRLMAFAMQAALAIENARLFEEVQRFAYQTSLLHDITHAAVSAPGRQVMLQRLADRLGELLRADGACILLWDETGQNLVQSGAYGRMRKVDFAKACNAGKSGIIELLKAKNKLVVVDDHEHHPHSGSKFTEGLPGKAFLGLPVMADERQLGVALVGFQYPHVFTPEETSAARQAVDQIALAIAKDRHWERERQRTAELARANSLILALGHVAAQIETASEPQEVMSSVGAEMHKLGLECLIALFDESSRQLHLSYVSLSSKKITQAEKILGVKKNTFIFSPDHFHFIHQVVEGKQPVFSADPLQMIKLALPGLPEAILNRLMKVVGIRENTKTIFLPLVAKETVIGTFWLWGDNLEESDLQAASVFTSQVAISLENARLYQEIQLQAVTDELTRLYNRRGVLEMGQREFSRSVRYNRPLSALMIDIDHFKHINDTHGHPIGDEVLRALADRCRLSVRREDVLARFGGEEFLVLLPETDLQNALGVADRLRRVISRSTVHTVHGEVHVAISIGVATRREDMKDLMDLISCADEALYAAKQAGRDRVVAG